MKYQTQHHIAPSPKHMNTNGFNFTICSNKMIISYDFNAVYELFMPICCETAQISIITYDKNKTNIFHAMFLVAQYNIAKTILIKIATIMLKIPNTKIEIYTDSDELIFSGVTDKDGKIIIKDLPINQKFYILEIEPATGYIKTDEKMYFEIKEDGEIVKCTMTNEKIVVEVPNTEENDSFLIEIISGIICVSGIGIIIYARKKSEEE